MSQQCRDCGIPMIEGHRFCSNCGAEFVGSERLIFGASPASVPEDGAKQITLEMTEIEARPAKEGITAKTWLVTSLIALGTVFLVWFYASPYIALHDLRKAALTGDTNAVKELIDFNALRMSFAGVLRQQLSRDNRGQPTSQNTDAAAFASVLAGDLIRSKVDAYLTPETIVNMAQGKTVGIGNNEIYAYAHRIATGASGDGDEPTISTGYESYGRFYVRLSPPKSKQRLVVVLLRSGLAAWRVSEVRLSAGP
jgi:Protein of unknown function (DUF2939)